MQTTNAITKLTKAGFQVTNTGNRYQAKANRQVISFVDQQGSIICINVRGQDDHDDAMSDYSAGVFCDNLKQAITLAH
jgi:hypothetical protein